MQMIKEQEKHFVAIQWMISSLHKDDNEAHPHVTLTNDNENWDAIKADLKRPDFLTIENHIIFKKEKDRKEKRQRRKKETTSESQQRNE